MLFKGLTVVVSPLLALMHDQVLALKKLNVEVACLDSTQQKTEIQRIHKDLENGTPTIKILYTTPEQIQTERFQSLLKTVYCKDNLSLFAIDEAHCISTWGKDFRKSYQKLSVLKKIFPNVPIIALTATATLNVRKDIIETLGLVGSKTFISSFNRPEISYIVKNKDLIDDPKKDLFKFLNEHREECGIIYCRTKKGVEDLVNSLTENKFLAEGYHSEKTKKERKQIQLNWISNKVQIIVATISFGMGIDKGDVRYVVHYTLPDSLESFYQQSGRCGRDKKKSVSLLYYSSDEKSTIQFLLSKEDNERSKILQEGFEKFIEFCTIKSCRRRFILEYFGEKSTQDLCKRTCDYCKAPTGTGIPTSKATILQPKLNTKVIDVQEIDDFSDDEKKKRKGGFITATDLKKKKIE